jgi:riboflavin synthase
MFTGIVTHLGKVIESAEGTLRFEADPELVNQLSKGESILVNGICLTAVSLEGKSFQINYMEETKAKTNISTLKVGDLVNLELPVKASSLMSGHIVQGHVDTVATLLEMTADADNRVLKFSLDKRWMRYLVEKGSVALNGISLTLIEVGEDYFTVGIIPHTWEKTMLSELKKGDRVNIEVDVLAKYLEKLTRR